MNGGIGLGLKLGFGGGGGGSHLGPEVFTDPLFDNPGAWGASGGWVVSGGKATLTAASPTGTVFELVGVIGERYSVTVEVESVSAVIGEGLKIRLGNTFSPEILTAGTHTFEGTQTGTTVQGCAATGITSFGVITAISSKQVIPN